MFKLFVVIAIPLQLHFLVGMGSDTDLGWFWAV